MDLKIKWKKRSLKAALTVEASIVITLIILVLGILLSLWIYKFHECWYTQVVSECLLTGSNKAVLDECYLNDINEKWERVKEESYLVPHDLAVQIDGDTDELRMQVSGKVLLWRYSTLDMDVKQKIKMIKPVTYIQKMEAIGEVIK